jgi:hypothetical protein
LRSPLRRNVLVLAFAVALAVPTAAPALVSMPLASADESVSSDNMSHVKTLEYAQPYGDIGPMGTDLEFATIPVAARQVSANASKAGQLRAKGKPSTEDRTFAFAGTYRNGLQIVDVTDPEAAEIVAVYDCAIAQGDVQVFNQGERWLVAYTADVISNHLRTESTCFQDAGPEAQQARWGTFLVDVTDPYEPQTVSFLPIERGSHNMTAHPSGDYLYNSNSQLITSTDPQIEIFDIATPEQPERILDLEVPFVPASLGSESHDITFNADGTRAYSAALSQTLVIDTTDPTDPEIIGQIVDPTINVHHQSDPYTTTDEDGNERTFLIIEDEFVGAVPTGQCPNGGVHVYDITGDLERNPQKVGYWNIDDVRPAFGSGVTGIDPLGGCTAHVFRIYPEQNIMTIAYYNGGVRVVDLAGLAGISVGENQLVGDGMREIGHFQFADADTWAAKTPGFEEDGSFYLFGNDMNRGMDVYRFDAGATPSEHEGRWMDPAQTALQLSALPQPDLSDPALTMRCMLDRD